MVVLVTGSQGQIGQAIQSISNNYPEIDFVFCNTSTLDITKKAMCEEVFDLYNPNYCINAAAYTKVDQAELEKELAFKTNAEGARNIAEVCSKKNSILIHLSTDFIFDGLNSTPYTELDMPNPINIYGSSKLEGEREIINLLKKHYIIRTSWIYSEFGNNFMKTMLKLAQTKKEIKVVNDQIGTPTYAVDIAKVILEIIRRNEDGFGIYNYSNKGQCSWYDFAVEIFRKNKINTKVIPIKSSEYKTKALRPVYSVLDSRKITEKFKLSPKEWKELIPTF